MSHHKDGLLTLLDDLGPISVFFYRGDSAGEGGSNQQWLMPVLFDLVVSRLAEGGVILTDGSNGGGAIAGPCQSADSVRSLPQDAEPGQLFTYRNRIFRCVYKGPKISWHHAQLAWQVGTAP